MNNISEIKKHLAEHWSAFESLLSSTLDSQSDMLNRINRYLFDTSGKQIRPLLASSVRWRAVVLSMNRQWLVLPPQS